MKLAQKTIIINPSFPIKQHGFIQQTEPIFNVHDDLKARIISIDDQSKRIIFISCDNLGFPYSLQQAIEDHLNQSSIKPHYVILSSTHTHFAADPHNTTYQKEIITQLSLACLKLEYIEYKDLNFSYQYIPYDEFGTSRISNHKANVYLQLLTIYNHQAPITRWITYNCHPTILHGDTNFFSAEYPGYLINKLSQKYPSQFFSFTNGADGDVSTRFTRITQDYPGLIKLTDKLFDKVDHLINQPPILYPLTSIEFNYTQLPLTHTFNPIDLTLLPSNLSQRELQTIEVGKKVREELSHKLDTLQKSVIISQVKFNHLNLIFAPNELFSSFINYIDINNSILICYSNGYSPYVLDINEHLITYEAFTDTLDQHSKQTIINTLKKYGQ